MRGLLRSFGYALRGIFGAVRSERNFRIHTVAAVTIAVFAWVFGVTAAEAARLALTVCAVMCAELVNTAVEAAVDLACREKCDAARLAKDTAAGAVLIMAVGAVLCAVFTFSDRSGWVRVFEFVRAYALWIAVYAGVCAGYIFGL